MAPQAMTGAKRIPLNVWILSMNNFLSLLRLKCANRKFTVTFLAHAVHLSRDDRITFLNSVAQATAWTRHAPPV